MASLFSTNAAQGASKTPRLRILCFHGFHGNIAALNEQIQDLKSVFSPYADLVFVDAPSHDRGGFGWWHAIQTPNSKDLEDPGVFGGPTTKFVDWELTQKFVIDTFKKQGPFDGILGFSQGGAMTGLVTGMRAPDNIPTATHPLQFNFAIDFSGYIATDPKLIPMYDVKKSYDIPSIHVIGKIDTIVPPANTKALAAKYSNPKILYHEDGHIIGATSEIKDSIRALLISMSEQKAKGKLSASTASASMPAAKLPSKVALWPQKAHPDMTLFFPKGQSAQPRPAVIVLPGGAYATPNGSGSDSAAWIAEQGMVGIRVEYGTQDSNSVYPENYADAARAIRIVRSKASEWGIDPTKIAMMGFSAGGHLAALVATQPNLFKSPKDDLASTVSARPDLLVLAYPLVSFVNGYSPGAYAGSVNNFFGKNNPDEATRRTFSSELHVSSTTPPTFIWTTDDDSIVPSEHTKLFVAALKNAKVPVKYTLYPSGRHGLGLAQTEKGDLQKWPQQLLVWFKENWGASL